MAEETIKGNLERITFHSEATGFSVLKVKVQGFRDLVTITGPCGSINVGEYIEAKGVWINDKKFGKQFKADAITQIQPTTLKGMEKYLGSGLIRGIGPKFAKILIDGFKERVFDVIEHEPHRLRELDGIGKKRIEQITQAWCEQKNVREIMVYLQSHGVGTARSARIYKIYGNEAIEKIKNNPYNLAHDIRGIGFKTADELAMNIGIEKNSMIRARAGILHIIQEKSKDGNCATRESDLICDSVEILGIEQDIITKALEEELIEKRLIRDEIDENAVIYSSWMYHAEVGIASSIKRLMRVAQGYQFEDIAKEIDLAEKREGIKLSAIQKEAVKTATTKGNVVVITGLPGTGKTTIVKTILSILSKKNLKIKLCAPTGRAAKRLSESTGILAKTIHRLLIFDPKTGKFVHDFENLLTLDVIVVDEASMVDTLLMNSLLKAIPEGAKLIIVGDTAQLPSVSPGKVLADIIASDVVPSIKLTEIFRQAATSKIIVNAHRINSGMMPIAHEKGEKTDFYTLYVEDSQEILDKTLKMVSERIPKAFKLDAINDIQVLSPMLRGALGCHSLNSELQKVLNSHTRESVKKYGTQYAVGDKVIQTVNNYDNDVFNGDIGFIESVNLEATEIRVNFDGKKVVYDFEDLDELELAYCITIHKSQGSEYPAVVIPVTMGHHMLLQRNLLYTGVTRGKKLVVLIGEKRAVLMAIKTIKQNERLTKLAERIKEKTTNETV